LGDRDTPADTSGAERGAPQSDGVGTATGSAAELGERAGTDWGIYTPAITRWAGVIGRPAPAPTELGGNGKPRLSPPFVEWLMGLPGGHVTDPAIGLTRNQQLKALGNGVVPQQAILALGLLTRQEVAA
jgi:DNA (cytosine-5)-methyltransferase 1